MRLAIGEAAAHRRSDTWRDVRVEDVHVERDVHEARARDLSSDSRTARSIPMRSTSLIVKTRTPASRSSRRSPSSSRRVPTSATRVGSTAGNGQASLSNPGPASPSAAASTIPWTFPLGLVSGVLMSEWASIQSTPPGP